MQLLASEQSCGIVSGGFPLEGNCLLPNIPDITQNYSINPTALISRTGRLLRCPRREHDARELGVSRAIAMPSGDWRQCGKHRTLQYPRRRVKTTTSPNSWTLGSSCKG